eukprot:TRINITY_DN2675_c0_g1_i20.p1 TRINITY_DN2675_c0_g1~~TRINITY_DN2675_c0_g1_i20.p1  ORF type:complete len:325 (+),score=48.59 TRINITY_DN2675_c0_g1_i20:1543-2517(+)
MQRLCAAAAFSKHFVQPYYAMLKGGNLSAASLPAWAAGVGAQLKLWGEHPQLLAHGLPLEFITPSLCQLLQACAGVAATTWEHFCSDLDDMSDCGQSQLAELSGVGATNCASERFVGVLSAQFKKRGPTVAMRNVVGVSAFVANAFHLEEDTPVTQQDWDTAVHAARSEPTEKERRLCFARERGSILTEEEAPASQAAPPDADLPAVQPHKPVLPHKPPPELISELYKLDGLPLPLLKQQAALWRAKGVRMKSSGPRTELLNRLRDAVRAHFPESTVQTPLPQVADPFATPVIPHPFAYYPPVPSPALLYLLHSNLQFSHPSPA